MSVIRVLVSTEHLSRAHLHTHSRARMEPAGQSPRDKEVEEGGKGATLPDAGCVGVRLRDVTIDNRTSGSGGQEEACPPDEVGAGAHLCHDSI